MSDVSPLNKNHKHNPLTEREKEVLTLVSNGLCNKEIARQLQIAERTVEAHLTCIYQKLQVASRLAAVRWLDKQRNGKR